MLLTLIVTLLAVERFSAVQPRLVNGHLTSALLCFPFNDLFKLIDKVKERLALRLDLLLSELKQLPRLPLLRLAVLRNPVLEGSVRPSPSRPLVELQHSVVLRCLGVNQLSVVDRHLVPRLAALRHLNRKQVRSLIL